MMKAATGLQQPVQWRGGVLTEAYKGKGAQSCPESFRSLFVSSVLGKAFHKVLRAKILPYADETFTSAHFGARKGAPVTIASLMVILFEKWQKKLGHSSTIMFLDVQSAYNSIVRRVALEMREPVIRTHRYKQY